MRGERGTDTGPDAEASAEFDDADSTSDRASSPSPGREGVDPVELGVELLEKFEGSELSVAAAVDRIETLTTNPRVTRRILETAQLRGIIERDGGVFRMGGNEFVRFESEVISKEGEFTCRRCNASITTGYFLELEAGEHGPFGSSCIRKVTGRDRE